jgi:hypothetical protein
MAAAAAADEGPVLVVEGTKETPSTALTEKFIRGLESYSITYSEVFLSQWRYCGGDTGQHSNYYRLTHPDYEFPSHHDACVCGHPIKENCYITDGEQMLVLGNCCIKKFLKKENSGRTCGRCGQAHKNRLDNFCKACRKTMKEEKRQREEEERQRLIELRVKLEGEKRKQEEERLRKERKGVAKKRNVQIELLLERWINIHETSTTGKKIKETQSFSTKNIYRIIQQDEKKQEVKRLPKASIQQRESLHCACGIHVCKCELADFELYQLNGEYICTKCDNWKCRCVGTGCGAGLSVE